MKLSIKTDSEDLLSSSFPPGAIEKVERVFREELPLLCAKLENYAEIEVSVSFLDSSEMRSVNKQHRGLDEPTDVLTFPMLDENESFVLPAALGLLSLGDILICPEETEREHAPMPRLAALCLVLSHGFLHLLGWDHDTPEKEEVMWERQELLKSKLLDAVNEAS